MSKTGVYTVYARPAAEDRAEIHDLISAYVVTFDNGNLDGFGRLLAGDAVVRMRSGGQVVDHTRGRAALIALFQGIREDLRSRGIQPRHHVSNVLVKTLGDARASVDAYLLYTEFDEASGATTVIRGGVYSFELERDADSA